MLKVISWNVSINGLSTFFKLYTRCALSDGSKTLHSGYLQLQGFFLVLHHQALLVRYCLATVCCLAMLNSWCSLSVTCTSNSCDVSRTYTAVTSWHNINWTLIWKLKCFTILYIFFKFLNTWDAFCKFYSWWCSVLCTCNSSDVDIQHWHYGVTLVEY